MDNSGDNSKNPFVAGGDAEVPTAAPDTSAPATAADEPAPAEKPAAPPKTIAWSAADTSSRQRGRGWYLAWIGIFVLLAGGSFALNWFFGIWQIWSTVGLAVIVFITLIVVNKQPSKTISYQLSTSEISVNDKKYPLADFRAFSVSNTSGIWMLSLIPTKRIGLPFDIVVPEAEGEAIVDLLGSVLPMEEASDSFAEKLSATLKF
jgi:hypothetical protein